MADELPLLYPYNPVVIQNETPEREHAWIQEELQKISTAFAQTIEYLGSSGGGGSGFATTYNTITNSTTWLGEGIVSLSLGSGYLQINYEAAAPSFTSQVVHSTALMQNDTDVVVVGSRLIGATTVRLHSKLLLDTGSIATQFYPIMVSRTIIPAAAALLPGPFKNTRKHYV